MTKSCFDTKKRPSGEYFIRDEKFINSELPATDFCEQKSMGGLWGPLSCTAGRFCRNKTDPDCGITQGVTCGFAVHLAFTWVCRQVSKTIRKAKTEANANWKITGAIPHTFQMDMDDFILRREVLPLVSFRFPVHPYPYIYSISLVLTMSMKYVNYTVVTSDIVCASWLNILANFFKKYTRFW